MEVEPGYYSVGILLNQAPETKPSRDYAAQKTKNGVGAPRKQKAAWSHAAQTKPAQKRAAQKKTRSGVFPRRSSMVNWLASYLAAGP
jgi:hypothetical protein